jgi:hypothetical protein
MPSCESHLDLHIDLSISETLDLDLAQLQTQIGSNLS